MGKPKKQRRLDDEFLSSEMRTPLRRFAAKVRVFTVPQARRLLKPHFQTLHNRGHEKTGDGWQKACRAATRQNIDLLEKDGDIVVLEERDYAIIRPVVRDHWYDSAVSDPSQLSRLAALIHQQALSPLPREDDALCVNRDEIDVVKDYHEHEGRSEFNGGQTLFSELALIYELSSVPADRIIAGSFQIAKLPRDYSKYADEYRGDCSLVIGNEKITVCCPWIPKFHMGSVRRVRDFLEALHERMDGKRYWLLSQHGMPSNFS